MSSCFPEFTSSNSFNLQYPLLEKLEEEHLSLLQERSDMVKKRRTQDDEDDLTSFLGKLPLPPKQRRRMISGELYQTHIRLRRWRFFDVPHASPGGDSARTMKKPKKDTQRTRSFRPSDEQAYSAAVEFLATKTKEVLSDVRAPEFRDPW